MLYIFLCIITFIISSIIKLYLYTGENKGFFKYFFNIFSKEKKLFLIDIFLVAVYFFLYKKYNFSILFFSNSILIGILLLISLIDIKSKIIPNKCILLGIALGAIVLVLNDNISIVDAFLGFVICGGIIATISIITKGDIGMGDAKLFGCIGIFFGLQTTLEIMLIATIISGLTGLILLTLKKVNRKTALPFAPFIFVGTMVIIIFS